MRDNIKNGIVTIRSGEMDYIRFGTGSRILVMLPGLGDGLRTVKGTALPLAATYRIFFRDFTVYVFSRVNGLPEGYTTRDMARDQAEAMAQLNFDKADIFGVSMGGMIAQYLAIDHPEKVNKLILTVTSARPNPTLSESIEEWIALAETGDHAAFMDSNLRRIYSQAYYKKNKWMIPAIGKMTKPESYDRFFIQAKACLMHNAYDRLREIKAPTFVVGAKQDLAQGSEASEEIAAMVPAAKLHIYEQWGHGVYEDAKDFNKMVLDFLNQ